MAVASVDKTPRRIEAVTTWWSRMEPVPMNRSLTAPRIQHRAVDPESLVGNADPEVFRRPAPRDRSLRMPESPAGPLRNRRKAGWSHHRS